MRPASSVLVIFLGGLLVLAGVVLEFITKRLGEETPYLDEYR